MRILVFVLAVVAGIPVARAADVAAGKALAEQVCAACHGANGVSVSALIPNLAGQKEKYISGQLAAFKADKRKNEMMNAIAGQLNAPDMENLAAFFAGLPGAAAGTATSQQLPNVAKTHLAFPGDYKATYTKYMTIDFPDRKQVRYYYASPNAVAAAKDGKPMPNGAYFFVEVHSTKLGADKKPMQGADGFLTPEKLLFFTAMAKGDGWGKDIPDMLKNGDWNYAVFNTDKSHRKGPNQAECLACHKPLDKDDYLFTLKTLRDVAMKK